MRSWLDMVGAKKEEKYKLDDRTIHFNENPASRCISAQTQLGCGSPLSITRHPMEPKCVDLILWLLAG